MSGRAARGPTSGSTVTEHLDELRRRLIISALALVVAFAGMYAVHDQLIDLLTRPLPDDVDQLITLSPTEPFFTTLKVTFWAAILVALPIWLYQAYAFVIPAVADQPRRIVLAVTSGLAGLFAAGVAFGYFVVLPVALNFLTGFGGDTFNTQLRAGEYFGFATTMLLASGILFEVPVAMTALSRMGITSARMYRTHWRIAIVGDRRHRRRPAGRRPDQHGPADDPPARALRRRHRPVGQVRPGAALATAGARRDVRSFAA